MDGEGTPVVDAIVLEYVPWRPADGARYIFSIACPYCGKKHTHGAGTVFEDIPQQAGHRVAHCASEKAQAVNDAGYILRVAEPVTIARKIPA
jgi:hypothetical protein